MMDDLNTKISNVIGITDCEDFMGLNVFQQHHIWEYLWKTWICSNIGMIVIDCTNIFPMTIQDKLSPIAVGVFKLSTLTMLGFTISKLLSAIGHFINYDKEMAAEREYNRKHGIGSGITKRGQQ